MREWLRNGAGINLHQVSAPGVGKTTCFYICWIDRNKNVNRQKTTHLGCFEAPGVLKTAPACIFHHI